MMQSGMTCGPASAYCRCSVMCVSAICRDNGGCRTYRIGSEINCGVPAAHMPLHRVICNVCSRLDVLLCGSR
jgi:hypothetical protein